MKKKLIITFAVFFAIISLNAQIAVPAAGGDGTGAGGTSSYSFGQVVYTTIGNETSLAQGVQQPFGNFTSSTPSVKVIPNVVAVIASASLSTPVALTAMVYPNPTSDKVTLALDNSTTTNLYYVLFDLKGSVMSTSLINQSQTSISLQNMASGFYILKVYQKATELKSFKILKK